MPSASPQLARQIESSVQRPSPSRDLARTTLGVLFIGGLIIATFWIMRPFLSAFLWAAMIVISTWPVLLALQSKLWGRRGLAAAALTSILLFMLVMPVAFSAVVIADNVDRIAARIQTLQTLTIPPPPDWLANVPLLGPKFSGLWQQTTSQSLNSLLPQIRPYAGGFLRWFGTQIGSLGAMVLQFLLTVIISAILYTKGESVARGVKRFAYRLGGPSGERVAILAAKSIRGVSVGVVVTAMIQALVAGLGLAIASVPAPVLLTAVVFILCLAQLGPLLVMLPVVVWKFYSGDAAWGTVLLILSVLAGTIDNVIRPILIRKGADLPLLLIFSGVVGGLMALGVIGIFVGPVILAVSYTLIKEWIDEAELPADSANSASLGSEI